MTYRDAVLTDGHYYHVYSRGNEKRDIFLDARDYSRFLLRTKEYAVQDKARVVCYCLMPNHYHLLLRQEEGGSISKFMHRLETGYAMYFNKRNNRVGHLFQGRFKSKIIEEDEHILQVSRYIHINPKEITKDPLTYRWSSLKKYTDSHGDDFLEKAPIYNCFTGKHKAKQYLEFVLSREPHADDATFYE